MIFSNNKFYISSLIPLKEKKEVVFIGRSNVGKSSLINAICENQSLAFVSKTPGHTKLLNYFNIGDLFYLVDAPGYGYRKLSAEKDVFDDIMGNYFENNPYCKLVVLLYDARRELTKDDINFINYLDGLNLESIIVYTKVDKLNQSLKQKALNNSKKCFPNTKIYFVSSLNKKGINELRNVILQKLEINEKGL